jgi:hypothetical protein
MRVQFKFRQRVSEDERAKIISSLREHVQRLFPSDPDQELDPLHPGHRGPGQRPASPGRPQQLQLGRVRRDGGSSQAHMVRLPGLAWVPAAMLITSTSAGRCYRPASQEEAASRISSPLELITNV